MTAGVALILGSGGAAYASAAASSTASPNAKSAGAGRLDAVQAAANARIQGRLATLHALELAVSDSKYLTSDQKSALGKQIDADLSGLTALATKAAAETTVAAVRADEVAMVDNYRVYLLMAPQVRLTDALAAESDAATTLQKAFTALTDLANKQSGGPTATQKAELADLQTQISAAQSAIANQVSTELGVQPGPDETAIHNALQPVKDAVKSAHQDLLKARADAKELRASLKS
jgi:ribonuclease HII